MEGSILPVPLLLLRFGTNPKDIQKFDKNYHFCLLRKLYVRLIFFLDDILLVASSKEELTLAMDTLIDLLQDLDFPINCKKSVFEPCQNVQFLRIKINSIEMTLTLPQEEKEFRDLLGNSLASIRELSQLIGHFASTAIAVLPEPQQYWAMQWQQNLELQEPGDYNSKITLPVEVNAELDWWVKNTHFTKRRWIIFASLN